jgi:hypothetical protein
MVEQGTPDQPRAEHVADAEQNNAPAAALPESRPAPAPLAETVRRSRREPAL